MFFLSHWAENKSFGSAPFASGVDFLANSQQFSKPIVIVV